MGTVPSSVLPFRTPPNSQLLYMAVKQAIQKITTGGLSEKQAANLVADVLDAAVMDGPEQRDRILKVAIAKVAHLEE